MMNPVFAFQLQAWALAAVFLYLKMISNSGVQGYARVKGAGVAVPEDLPVFAKGHPQARVADPTRTAQNPDLLARAGSCWRNDLENIPMFLILTLAYVLVGANTNLLVACLYIFCLARLVHTVAFLKKLQPLRTLAYGVAALANLVVAGAVAFKILF